MTQNKRLLLTSRPVGLPVHANFELVSQPLPVLTEGQILVRNHYCSLDPAIRGWMDDVPSYFPPIALGAPVRATTLGVIAESANPGFKVGQWVLGVNGIEDYSVAEAGGFTSPVDAGAVPSVTNYLSVLGAVGLTAYFGLLDVGKPLAGETVLVSGAAGAVGSLVGQIAKIKGCRAVGLAGGPEKCARLLSDYNYDVAIDYRGKDLAALTAEIAAACPNGVDIFFDNVGGVILDAALANIANNGRALLCGLISQYNAVKPEPGPTNMWNLIARTARIEGFLIGAYLSRWPEGAAEMSQWIAAGKLHFREHIDTGIENAVDSFLKLFSGKNDGKLILKLADA